jgi:hypothetical protein
MVFITDEGSEFNAPLDKVWKLNQLKRRKGSGGQQILSQIYTESQTEGACIAKKKSTMRATTFRP